MNEELPIGVHVAGHLSEQEALALNALQQEQRSTLLKLGTLEVQKQQQLRLYHNSEQKGRSLLQGVATRLGIASDVPWQVQADGAVLVQGVAPGQDDDVVSEESQLDIAPDTDDPPPFDVN